MNVLRSPPKLHVTVLVWLRDRWHKTYFFKATPTGRVAYRNVGHVFSDSLVLVQREDVLEGGASDALSAERRFRSYSRNRSRPFVLRIKVYFYNSDQFNAAKDGPGYAG